MSAIETDLLKPELVFFDFEATDRIDFFTKLGEKLKEGGYVKDSWLDAILEREKNYPTGLECTSISVALPHVDPQHLNKPYIAIIKPKNPIEFDGMADTGLVNAQLIINLGLLAHEEGQVAVLQAFLGIFIDDAASADIMAQTTPQGLVDSVIKYCAELASPRRPDTTRGPVRFGPCRCGRVLAFLEKGESSK
ncbi:MAG: PTS sugar transporter subunit IIA [Bifidobacterium sp.]|nr:PTS sugar transporter subunit IIA [Bifidobacterium sp.]